MTRRGNCKRHFAAILNEAKIIRFNHLHMQLLPIPAQKRIALVAHDNRKSEMLDWVREHHATLKHHHLSATGTTGSLIERETWLACR
jgi:hypothetical protein